MYGNPEIGPLCFWSLRLLWVLNPETVLWTEDFPDPLRKEAILRMHHCNLCAIAFSVCFSLYLSEDRGYETIPAGASHDSHLFPLPFKILSHWTLKYIWHRLQTGFMQIWSKLCKKLYCLDIKISFWKEKKGGVLSSIFTFSLCVIANDEREDQIRDSPHKTSIAGILQRDLSPFSVFWHLNRVRR